MNDFKVLVPVHEAAFKNWKQFAIALLGHTNAYTLRVMLLSRRWPGWQ